jgi:hypothetical protein
MLEAFDRKKDLAKVRDSMGRNLTISLFKETNDGRTEYKPLWSIKDWKEVYLDLADPTEYAPAIYLIGDWDHWIKIAENSQARPYFAEWRKELVIKLRSEAIKALRRQAVSDKGTAAAKWLAENGFILDNKTKKKITEESEQMYKDVLANAER